MNQDPIFRQTNSPDVMPSLKGPQFIMWIIFFVSVILRTNRGWAGIGALGAGIVRRGGMPKFSQEYLQAIVFEEDMQLLGVLSVASMQGSLTSFAPLILYGLITIAKISQNPQGVSSPVDKIVNLGFLKTQLAKVTANQ